MPRAKKYNKENGYNRPFPVKLRKKMEEKKKTQDMLAEYVGVSRQTISQWKNGISMPDIDSLKKIAEFFECSSDCLLGLDEYEDKGSEEIRKLLGLTKESSNILINLLKAEPDNSITKTLNLLISDRAILSNMAVYFYYKLGGTVPFELIYEPTKNKNFGQIDGELLNYSVDANISMKALNDDLFKKSFIFQVQSDMERLRGQIETEKLKGE